MSLLDTRPDDFRERNLFFWATLGILSHSQQLDALLDQQPTTDTPPDLDDEALLAMLGLVALSRKCQAHIAAAAEPPPIEEATAAEERLPSLRELLR